VNIDVTPPRVAYSGNLLSYTVDQDVQISCSATDTLSGIATNTCTPIVGPAYSFNIGTNGFSFTASDLADNSSTATTSFVVKVTFGSLCNLSRRFSNKPQLGDALCQKLSIAAEANTMQAKEGALQGFVHLVEAQSGKALTVDGAAVLGRLVRFL
jgi:hypothetical protein